MIFYKCEVSFNGKEFLGWQKQKDFSPTVQEKIDLALEEIFKSRDVSSVACGRTDSGVHAYKMTIKLKVPFEIDPIGLRRALNSKLDNMIRVNTISFSDKDFRPTYDAKSREYFYLFTDREELSPFEVDYIAKFKGTISEPKVREALNLFIGEHDFVNYMCVGSDPKTTVREIFEVSIEQNDPAFHGLIGTHYKITIKGNGFLKQMVRLIVGTAISYGQGKLDLETIRNSLESEVDSKPAPVSPACGLYKSEVLY